MQHYLRRDHIVTNPYKLTIYITTAITTKKVRENAEMRLYTIYEVDIWASKPLEANILTI